MRAVIDSYDCPFCDLNLFTEGFIIDKYTFSSIKPEKGREIEILLFIPPPTKIIYKICRRHTEESNYATEKLISILKEYILSVINKQKDKETQHELRLIINELTNHSHDGEDY